MSQSNKKGGFAALYDLAEKKKAEQKAEREEKSTPVTPVTPVTGVTGVTRVKEDAAPKRDFTRVANSVVRDAIPAGMFTGKGKQLYDFLYSQTRGAIVPARSARIPTDRVMKGAGMTRHTYRAHLERLIHVGLVQVEERPGEHGGNLFTVYLPEEVGVKKGDRGHRGHRGHQGDTTEGGHSGQNLPLVQGSQIDPCDRGLSIENTEISSTPKTSFKTKDKHDDEAFARFIRVIQETTKEVTGKESSNSEVERWRELAELLSTELKIAAARTNVSSVPAFLTEHLRRRLWKVDKKQISREEKPTNNSDKQSFTPEQIRHCPDCGGSGMYYPDGFEKGVAKCRHSRLKLEESPAPKA